jgi:chromosome segregation ATPase
MSDSIRIACPNCQKTLRIPPEYLGKKAQCKRCGEVFRLTAPEPSAAAASDFGAETEAKIVERSHELDEARAEVESLRGQLAEEQAKAEAEIAGLRRELDEASRRRDTERQSVEADWQSRLDASESDSAKLRDEADSLRGELEACRSDVENLKLRLESETVRLNGELGTHRAEIESLKTQMTAEAERLNGEVAGHLETISGLRAEVGQSQLEVERVLGEWDRLRVEGTRLSTALSDAETARQEDFERLTQEIERLRGEASAASARAEEQLRLVKLLRAEIDDGKREREAELSAWSADRERLTASEAERRQRVTELEAGLDEETRKAESLSAMLEESTAKQSALELELDEGRKATDELKVQLAQANDFRHQIRTFLGGLGIKLPS